MSSPHQAARALDRLRGFRVKPAPAAAVGGTVAKLAAQANDRHRALGRVLVGVMSALPSVLARRVIPHGLVRGVLMLEVDDASARYELDRWLRAGGLDRLGELSGGKVKGVRLKWGV